MGVILPLPPCSAGCPKKTPSGAAGWCLRNATSGLLRSRLLAEVMVIGHAPAELRVELPAHRALGVLALRFDDLLEQRVRRPILRADPVEDIELFLPHRVRRRH